MGRQCSTVGPHCDGDAACVLASMADQASGPAPGSGSTAMQGQHARLPYPRYHPPKLCSGQFCPSMPAPACPQAPVPPHSATCTS